MTKAQDQIKSVYEDNEAEINGTIYKLTKFKHHERLKVFELLQNSTNQKTGEMKIPWSSNEFKEVQKMIDSKVLVDDMQISKHKNYWDEDENIEDYMPYIMTMLQVIAYPFMKGNLGM